MGIALVRLPADELNLIIYTGRIDPPIRAQHVTPAAGMRPERESSLRPEAETR